MTPKSFARFKTLSSFVFDLLNSDWKNEEANKYPLKSINFLLKT